MELDCSVWKQDNISMYIEFPVEPEDEHDYMGRCGCGCRKKLYKGMTVLPTLDGPIYVDCWQDYIYQHMVTLGI